MRCSPRFHLACSEAFAQRLGARNEDIINDYALTSVGLQTVLPVLPQRFQKEDVLRNYWKDALSLGTAKYVVFYSSVRSAAWYLWLIWYARQARVFVVRPERD